MAYLPTNQNPNAEQQQPGQQPQPVAGQPPTSSAGAGAAPTSLGTPPPAATASSASSSASSSAVPAQAAPSYPLITDYLRANQGAGTSLANKMGADIGSEVSSAKQQSDAAQSAYNTANQGTIDQWRTAVQGIQSQNAQGKQAADSQLAETLYRLTQSERNSIIPAPYWEKLKADFAAHAYDNYAPQDVPTLNLPGYETPLAVTKAQSDLTGAVGALGTDAGRQAVLSRSYGSTPTYTAGANALDATLLGQAGAQSKLQSQYGDIIAALSSVPAIPTVDTPVAPATLPGTWQPYVGGQLRPIPAASVVPLNSGRGY